MSFDNALFPTNISYGSSGGPKFKTDVLQLDSGYEQRISHWDAAIREYDVSYGIKSYDDLAAVRKFFIERQGAGRSFRYKDFLECASTENGIDEELGGAAPTATDVQIGLGDATTKTFQLITQHVTGGVIKNKLITKPEDGTVLIAFDGVAQASGWSVNVTTGVVTFTSAPAQGVVITAGFKFHIQVRFAAGGSEMMNLKVDDFGSGSVESINLVEVLDQSSSQITDYPIAGGSVIVDLSTDKQISLLEGRVFIGDQGTGKLILPPITSLPTGGPLLYIIAGSGTISIYVYEQQAEPLVTLFEGYISQLFVVEDANANKLWVAV